MRIAAVEIDGTLHFVERTIVFAKIERRVAEERVCAGIEVIERDRLARQALCVLQGVAGVCRPAFGDGMDVDPSQPDIGGRVFRIERDRLLEQPARLGSLYPGRPRRRGGLPAPLQSWRCWRWSR